MIKIVTSSTEKQTNKTYVEVFRYLNSPKIRLTRVGFRLIRRQIFNNSSKNVNKQMIKKNQNIAFGVSLT